jgi:hypothetical protein
MTWARLYFIQSISASISKALLNRGADLYAAFAGGIIAIHDAAKARIQK